MKHNEPVGRKAHREEKQYQSLSNTLKESGIKTIWDAENFLERLQTRKMRTVYVLLAILLIAGFIFPKAFGFIVMFSALILLWVLRTTKNTRMYVQRYIDEELSAKDKPS